MIDITKLTREELLARREELKEEYRQSIRDANDIINIVDDMGKVPDDEIVRRLEEVRDRQAQRKKKQ